WTVAAIFLWAAYSKLTISATGPTIYQHWVDAYPLLRFVLPAIEAGLAVWLIAGRWPRGSSIAAILIVSLFCGLLAAEMFKRHPRPCGCMGAVAEAYEPARIRAGLVMGIMQNFFIMGGASVVFVVASRDISRNDVAAEPEASNN